MKRALKYVVTAAALFVMVVVLWTLADVQGLQRQGNNSQSKRDDRLEAQASADSQTIAGLAATVADLRHTIDLLTGQIAALSVTADRNAARIADLQTQLAVAQVRQAQLAALVTSQYRQLLAQSKNPILVPVPAGASPPTSGARPGPTTSTTTRTPTTAPPCLPLLHDLGVC